MLSLAADTPSELPSRVCVAGELSVVLPSPPTILVVERVASDETGRERDVLALGSGVVLLPWFVVALSPLPGGVVSRLAAEAVAGKGLPVEGEVAPVSAVACSCVRVPEVSRTACVSALPASVDERLASVVSERAEDDGLGLGALGTGLCVAGSAVTGPDATLVKPGAEEGAEEASAVEGWEVAVKPTSAVPLLVLACGLGVAGEDPAGELEEERVVVAERGF